MEWVLLVVLAFVWRSLSARIKALEAERAFQEKVIRDLTGRVFKLESHGALPPPPPKVEAPPVALPPPQPAPIVAQPVELPEPEPAPDTVVPEPGRAVSEPVLEKEPPSSS